MLSAKPACRAITSSESCSKSLVGAGDKRLIYMGANRVLEWDQTLGQFRLLTLSMQDREFFPSSAVVLQQGIRRAGERALWLGSNQVIFWNPQRVEADWVNLQGGSQPRFTTNGIIRLPMKPLGDMAYLGRGRLFVWNHEKAIYQVWHFSKGKFQIETAYSDFSNPVLQNLHKAAPRKMVWLGGDRLLAWAPAGKCDGRNHIALSLGHRPKALPANKDFGSSITPSTQIIYLGGNRALFWDGGSEPGHIASLPYNCQFHLGLEDYLEVHPEIRASMIWEVSRTPLTYDMWGTHPHTEDMYPTLSRFMKALEPGLNLREKPQNLVSFEWGLLKRDPNALSNKNLSRRTAKELYLAHLARRLSAEITGRTSRKLDEYRTSELSHLFSGPTMFQGRAGDRYQFKTGTLVQLPSSFAG